MGATLWAVWDADARGHVITTTDPGQVDGLRTVTVNVPAGLPAAAVFATAQQALANVVSMGNAAQLIAVKIIFA